LAAPLAVVLDSVEGYRFADQTISAEEQRIAGMSKYVARVYSRDTVPVFSTYVGYYERQSQGKTIHSPRNCLPGAGWEILVPGVRDISVAGTTYRVNRNVLKNGKFTAIVYYWYQGRGRVVADEYRVKWNLLRDAALLGHTEEALVRLIIPVGYGSALSGATEQNQYSDANTLADSLVARMIVEVGRALPGTSESSN
jgi:EpsI family protein